MWYSFNELRSHDCMMSFVLSNRGGGKTYGAKMIGIKDWIKKREQFVYVRRYDTELETRQQFFDDIIANNEFPGHEFKVRGYKGYIRQIVYEDEEENDWEVLCYFIPLSIANNFKSTPYPLVTKIFYDEVIIDISGNQHYLKNEPRILMELLSTIIRKRNGVKFFGMANNVSLVNPHFIFWNIKVNPNKRFTKSPNGKIVVELFKDSDFIDEMLNTEFGSLIAETDYGKYAIFNESLCDNTAFIKDRPSNLEYKVGFIIEGKEIHCWYDTDSEAYYIDDKGIGDTNKNLFAITTQDYTPNISSISIAKQKYIVKHLKLYYQHSQISYANLTIQQLFQNLVKYI